MELLVQAGLLGVCACADQERDAGVVAMTESTKCKKSTVCEKGMCFAALPVLAAGFAGGASDLAPPRDDADWARFLADQDHVVEGCLKPGILQGAWIGDGTMGSLIFREKQDPATLRWVMGRYDIIGHGTIFPGEFFHTRLFAGDILLRPTGAITNESLRQSVWNGEASGTIVTDRGRIAWRSYVHRVERAFVVEMTTEGDESAAELRVREQWGVSPNFGRGKDDPGTSSRGPELPAKPTTTRRDGLTLITQPLQAKAAHAVAWTVRTLQPNRRVLIATLGAAYDDRQPREVSVARAEGEALGRLKNILARPLDRLDEDHRAWWHRHLVRSRLALPEDPVWERFWWLQIAKFASASAEDSPFIIDTSGPWVYKPAWGAVWWNLNVQLSYYPAFSANRLDTGRSLLNGMQRLYASGVLNRNAGPHAADSLLMGRCSDFHGEGSWGDELGNLTWVLHDLWRYWRHSGDDSVARWLFPVLKQDVNYYLHHLTPGPDGKLHLSPTRSPEFDEILRERKVRELIPDANYALASLHWAIDALIDLDTRFAFKDPLRPRWEEVRRDLIPMPAGAHGLKLGGDQEFDASHRHFSHLLGIHPYHILNPDQGPWATDLIRRSVDHFTSMPKAFVGYSYTAASCMYATLGDGEQALAKLDKLLEFCGPNTIYCEGNMMVIETPLSAVESVNYMLLQSWGDTVRVFPAMPKRWKNAAFEDFSAEGAFLVSARWVDGRVARVKIRSLAGNPLRLRLPPDAGRRRTLTAPAEAGAVTESDGLIRAQLQKGQELTVTCSEKE